MKKFLLLLLVVLFVFTACDNSIKPIRFAFGGSESSGGQDTTDPQPQPQPDPPKPEPPEGHYFPLKENNKIDKIDLYVLTPLTIKFTAEGGGTITIKNVPSSGMWFSLSDGVKKKVEKGTEGVTSKYKSYEISVKEDAIRLYAKGTGNELPEELTITCDKECEVYGNIMSLFCDNDDLTGFEKKVTVDKKFAFRNLFKKNTYIVSAENLYLPATTLTEGAVGCYGYMFEGCTSLKKAPVLPAETLATSCYSGMFKDCKSLKQAPELPATKLADSCYYGMFEGCTNLTQAPELPATTLADECYYQMFSECTGLTKAPNLPATTLASSCYTAMFSGCTSLTQAPALPATTLADECYWFMFNGCTSLTQAPDLPATTLVKGCYKSMFKGCTKLESLTCLVNTAPTNNDYTEDWLVDAGKDVKGKKPIFYHATSKDWDPNDEKHAQKDEQGYLHYYGIPEGWEQKKYEPQQ